MREKGGYLHIIFIFIGVACISLGAFNYMIDSEPRKTVSLNPVNEDDKKNDVNNKVKKNENNTIKEIEIYKDEDNSVLLGNGNTVNLTINTTENLKELLYNGDVIISFNDVNGIEKYFVYNDNIIVFDYSIVDMIGFIYVIDSDKNVQKKEEIDINNRIMIPTGVELSNNKLVVIGSRLNDSTLSLQSEDISLCNEEDLVLHNILDDAPTKVEYNLNITNKNITFDFVKVLETVGNAKKLVCTTLE